MKKIIVKNKQNKKLHSYPEWRKFASQLTCYGEVLCLYA